jgi:prevent-host-death family protein
MDMKSISATDAKNRFGDLLSEAAREPVSIEKNGRVVAVVVPAPDYERARGVIALGRVTDRIGSGHKETLAILREYSARKRTRQATMTALGLETYGQLLRAVRRAGLEGPTLPKAEQEAMIRELIKVVRG